MKLKISCFFALFLIFASCGQRQTYEGKWSIDFLECGEDKYEVTTASTDLYLRDGEGVWLASSSTCSMQVKDFTVESTEIEDGDKLIFSGGKSSCSSVDCEIRWPINQTNDQIILMCLSPSGGDDFWGSHKKFSDFEYLDRRLQADVITSDEKGENAGSCKVYFRRS